MVIDVDAEFVQDRLAFRADGERAVVRSAQKASLGEKRVGDCCAECSGEMGPLFAPVEASACERAARRACPVDVDAELGELDLPERGESEGVVGGQQQVAGEERIGQSDSEPAGEMVVTGSCVAEGGAGVCAAERADLFGWGDSGERFGRVGDLGRGECVATFATVGLAADESAVE